MRVLAAMSGGVDSAVAAARAVEAGHDVTGVHLALSRAPQSHRTGARGCCTVEDARDARRAADVLGIPFYVWDMAERFHADVVEDFLAEYAAGRTPNPCVRCNERIKFAAVLDKALALGFDAVCTGHYAVLVDDAGVRTLHRSVDAGKDQSYVLGVLTPEQLAHSLFPLGGSTKEQVRAEAARRGLAVADKPDSHDVCFIADGDTAGWLRQRIGPQPGRIVDETGAVVGEHDGAYGFTVGQRRGLRLGVPAPDGKPRYVLDVSPVDRTVTVGPRERLAVDELVGGVPVWCGPAPQLPLACRAQVRAHGEAVPARADVVDGALVVQLDRPVHGVAPGQSVVLYVSPDAGDDSRGERVVGSATIARASQRSTQAAGARA
ncbi:MAG TPA: tRNA 2-thiouridine(34) synthase MnmA [Motilibacteraceae bacterium]|nr:tRNA 2-thiouridine(34) synthase MnmA [Motilibacteraceae bacterium]